MHHRHADTADTLTAEYHPYVLTHLQPVLDIMAEHDIRVESYGPLSPLLRHPTGGPIKPVLERIAQRLSKEIGEEVDAAMALLLWTRSKGVVAVTASGNNGRIAKLALTQQLPELTKDEVEEIEALGRKVHFRAYVRGSSCLLSRHEGAVALTRGTSNRTSTCALTSRRPTCPRISRDSRVAICNLQCS